MSILTRLFGGDERIKRLQAKINQLQNNRNFQYYGNSHPVYPSTERYDIPEKYSSFDDVYSIVNKLSNVCAGIDIYAYLEKEDEESVKKFKKLSRKMGVNPPTQIMEQLRKKALEDVEETDPVAKLLESPSVNLSRFEFYKGLYSFLFLHGEVIIHKQRLGLGVNAGNYTNMELWYPQYTNINVTSSYPSEITGYNYEINGQKIHENVPPEDIIHLRYFNPNYDIYGTELRGLSPLKVALKRLTRLESNMDASVAQLQNGGTPSIVYDKIFDNSDVNVIGSRKDNFYRFIQDKNNKGVPYFAAGEMGAINLGLKLTDMEVMALADVDFDKLCNIWGVSSTVFNSKAANTESNVKEQKKSMYTDVCIPQVKFVAGCLQKDFREDFKVPYIIDPDTSSIIELQQDKKEQADIFSALPIMNPALVMEAFGYGVDENDEAMNKTYVKTGYTTLDNLMDVPELPIVTNNGR